MGGDTYKHFGFYALTEQKQAGTSGNPHLA